MDRVAHEDKAAVLTSRVQLVTATTNEDLNKCKPNFVDVSKDTTNTRQTAWERMERHRKILFYYDNFGEMLTAATARLLLIKPPYFCVITLIMSVFCIINI